MSSFFMVKIPPLAEQTVAHVEQASVVELAGKMDNDITYVDHVCVKTDDGMGQINIKIFYK